MAYRKIVVGTDGSDTAGLAVTHAAKLAAEQDARLVLVSAFEAVKRSGMESLAGTEPHEVSEARAGAADLDWTISDRSAAEAVLRRARESAHGDGVTDIVVLSDDGDPASVVVEAAEFHSADLIVVGSVGLSGADRFLLGSVATSVLHHAPCDVLVVHTD